MNDDKNIYQDEPNRFVRFEWAIRDLLKRKDNLVILEGLITVILNEEIHIVEILEETTNDNTGDKYDHIDIKAKNKNGDNIYVRIQIIREIYYIEQTIYGEHRTAEEEIRTSKIINGVKKVYFISLLYFNAGEGDDYIYRSRNSLIGVNTNDKLRISSKGNNIIRLSEPGNITPECYVIRLENFKRSKTTPIEDWMDYLKTGNIRRETIAPGLQEAREKLLYYSLDKTERTSYYNHLSAIMVQNDVLDTAKMEGRAEGEAKGRAEEKISIARGLIKMNMPLTDIANVTGLSIEEIKGIEA